MPNVITNIEDLRVVARRRVPDGGPFRYAGLDAVPDLFFDDYVVLDGVRHPTPTHPDALACLCRRHHRAKTLGVWRYARTPEGHYLWHGPHAATYLVTPEGTSKLA